MNFMSPLLLTYTVIATASLMALWARFIEARLLSTSTWRVSVARLPARLAPLKIVHLSDIHCCNHTSAPFFQRTLRKVKALDPDLIVLTGDCCSYGKLTHPELLDGFLASLSALCPCIAVLGNHDYSAYVSSNEKGEYDVLEQRKSIVKDSLKRLMFPSKLKKVVTARARQVVPNEGLCRLFDKNSVTMLHNRCVQLSIRGARLNVCGLGDYMTGSCLPDVAFADYAHELPGVILSHNPDTIHALKDFPGDVVLCGHTHGGQVNIPWARTRTSQLEDLRFYHGCFQEHGKTLIVNRGLGSPVPLRIFAPPEIGLIVLEPSRKGVSHASP